MRATAASETSAPEAQSNKRQRLLASKINDMVCRRRTLLRPHLTLSVTAIAASIICFAIHSSGSLTAAPLPVLVLLPDVGNESNITSDWDYAQSVFPDRDRLATASIIVSQGSGDVLSRLCEAFQQHQPALLLSFLKPRDVSFARILSASTLTPLLTASREYGPATFVKHPQVSSDSETACERNLCSSFLPHDPSVT